MDKVILKGIISCVIGLFVGLILGWGNAGGVWGWILSIIISPILGYFLINPLLMSDEETRLFEEKLKSFADKKDDQEK